MCGPDIHTNHHRVQSTSSPDHLETPKGALETCRISFRATAPQPSAHTPLSTCQSLGKTTVARFYYRLLKDLGVFADAEKKAQEAQRAAEAAAKKRADVAEKARQDAERRAFQSAGLPYTEGAARASAPASAAGHGTATDGFVETTGAALADKGVAGLREMLEKIRKAGGGVLFVDEVRLGAALRGNVFWLGAVVRRRNSFCFLFLCWCRLVNAGRGCSPIHTLPLGRSVGLTIQMTRNRAERCVHALCHWTGYIQQYSRYRPGYLVNIYQFGATSPILN